MSKREGSRYELYKELERAVGGRAVMLMEKLLATKDDIDRLELKMDAMEARLESKISRTILMVNVPSILGAVGLAFAATRLG
jgi:hypothetical protein